MRLTLFDLDHTLLDGDSDQLWCEFLIDRGVLPREPFETLNRDMARDYAAGHVSAQAFCDFYISTLAGRSADEWQALRRGYIDGRVVPRITDAAMELVARHRDAGDLVLLTTATCRFLSELTAVHLGIATQTDGGLMVPVLRHAEARDLWATAAEIARLAEAARAGRATREELAGSTITITSLGALGGIVTTPVINHPEVAIVGVNRIVERPMMRGGAVVPRLMMNLSSSFDHRVVDGAHGAEFVQALRGALECPATLFVE